MSDETDAEKILDLTAFLLENWSVSLVLRCALLVTVMHARNEEEKKL